MLHEWNKGAPWFVLEHHNHVVCAVGISNSFLRLLLYEQASVVPIAKTFRESGIWVSVYRMNQEHSYYVVSIYQSYLQVNFSTVAEWTTWKCPRPGSWQNLVLYENASGLEVEGTSTLRKCLWPGSSGNHALYDDAIGLEVWGTMYFMKMPQAWRLRETGTFWQYPKHGSWQNHVF